MATPSNTRTLRFSATGFEKFCMGLFFYLGIFCLFLGFYTLTTTNSHTIPAWAWLVWGSLITYFGLRWMLQFQTTLLLDLNSKALLLKTTPWQKTTSIAFEDITSTDIKKDFLLIGTTSLPTLTLSITNTNGQIFFKRRRPATKKIRLEMAAQLMEIRAALHKHTQK